ncbi:MAG: AAA family ATPase [Planctomycetes bacterium]|nr:AAA family ATPase [Planctomycetota bacterium]
MAVDKILSVRSLDPKSWVPAEMELEEDYQRTKHFAHYPLLLPEKLDEKVAEIQKHLAIEKDVLLDIVSALATDNVIVEGPPGTGKTDLVKMIARDVFSARTVVVTANEDWTGYDVIGGLSLSIVDGREVIKPRNGSLVNCVLECCKQMSRKVYADGMNASITGEPQAVWFILDEMSRGKPDRYLGELFSVFGGEGERELSLYFHEEARKKRIFVPARFRILATLNASDREYMYEMSEGLSRRFQTIRVAPPTLDGAEMNFARELVIATNRVARNVLALGVTSPYWGGDQFRARDVLSMAAIEEDESRSLRHEEVFNVANPYGKVFDLIRRIVYFVRYHRLSGAKKSFAIGHHLGTSTILDIMKTCIVRPNILGTAADQDFDAQLVSALDFGCASRLVPLLAGRESTVLRRLYDFFGNELRGPDDKPHKFPKTMDRIWSRLTY